MRDWVDVVRWGLGKLMESCQATGGWSKRDTSWDNLEKQLAMAISWRARGPCRPGPCSCDGGGRPSMGPTNRPTLETKMLGLGPFIGARFHGQATVLAWPLQLGYRCYWASIMSLRHYSHGSGQGKQNRMLKQDAINKT